MKKTFEDFLEDWFCKVDPTVNKYNFEDEYDRWLSDLEDEDWIKLANLWGREQYLRAIEEILTKLRNN